jgi:ketosteroid isomerase-like protein
MLLVAVLVLVASGCAGEPEPTPEPGEEGRGTTATAPSEDAEADQQGVIEAHKAFVRAWESADVEGVVNLLDAPPQLLIFHPNVRTRFDDLDEVREGLVRMHSKIGEADWVEAHPIVTVRGDVAWLTMHIAIEAANIDPFVARGTEIWVRDAAGWRLTHAHWSPDPEQ